MKRQNDPHILAESGIREADRLARSDASPSLAARGIICVIQLLRARMRTVLHLSLALLALLVIVDAIPELTGKEHAHTAVERWPGFWAIYGFAGCVIIIVASKQFGHSGIMQREDYYDE